MLTPRGPEPTHESQYSNHSDNFDNGQDTKEAGQDDIEKAKQDAIKEAENTIYDTQAGLRQQNETILQNLENISPEQFCEMVSKLYLSERWESIEKNHIWARITQRGLNLLEGGGDNNTLVVDGTYGPETQKAVKNFQQKYDTLTNDGWAGPSTLQKIVDILKKQSKNEAVDWEINENSDAFVGPTREDLGKLNPEYTLSKSMFYVYFEGDDFRQSNIGNCWLLSTIDSITHLKNYEDLIRRSVTRTPSGFDIIMPLGSPSGQGSKISVSAKEYEAQTSIFGELFQTLEGKQGLKALVIAYGKYATGKNDHFDIATLSGGLSGAAYNGLISGIYTYRDRNFSPEGPERKKFTDTLTHILENFDPKKSLLSVGVNQGNGYDQLKRYNNFDDLGRHAVSVEQTYTKDDTLYITLSNPRDSKRSYDISLEKLLEGCYDYDLGTFSKQKGLPKFNENEKSKRTYTYEVQNNKKGAIQTLNQVIQITGGLDTGLSEERGDVVANINQVTNGEITGLKIKSWGKTASFTKNGGNYLYTIEGKKLIIKEDTFKNDYQEYNQKIQQTNKKLEHEDDSPQKELIRFNDFLYAPRLTVFINRMLHDYIDTDMGDSKNPAPFSIDTHGSLVFDDSPGKRDGKTYIRRLGAELLGDDTISCLHDRDLLGIDPNDQPTKEKIASFLNSLYTSSNGQ